MAQILFSPRAKLSFRQTLCIRGGKLSFHPEEPAGGERITAQEFHPPATDELTN